ncbi:MAG: hypothetical protein H6700_07795 [Myxococcales bacterium]|nr:hypothetical protein [Myxococcales bacterium]MCB9531653.1 hypothetical protein [Myxococcales bacterium]
MSSSRRVFLAQLARATAGVVLVPAVSRCGGAQPTETGAAIAESAAAPAAASESAAAAGVVADPMAIPMTPPDGWDPVAFNTARGNAGAIPATYLPSINGPDGATAHLGKHLPYVPEVAPELVPENYVAIMWGDAAKGYSRHPNAVRSEANNNQGHWYNWIRVRKATDETAEELQSTYSEWPGITDGDNGSYAVVGEGAITDDDGKNTVYLAAVPADCAAGDVVRVHAHCLTHGEYVDFITLP